MYLVYTNPISEDRVDEYVHWYRTKHMPDVLTLDGWVHAIMYRTVWSKPPTSPEMKQFQFCVTYLIEADDLDKAFADIAEAAATSKFGTKATYPIADEFMTAAYAEVMTCSSEQGPSA